MSKDTTTDALELLMDQHDEVESLIEQIESADDPDEKLERFQMLADSFAAHSMIEEKMFYPSVMHESTRELLVAFTEEHLSAKRLIADMMDLDPGDEHFDAKLTVLKEQIRHHARDEEEEQLFPKVRALFDDEELAALGNELIAKYEEVIAQEPRRNVPEETREAAPLF